MCNFKLSQMDVKSVDMRSQGGLLVEDLMKIE